MNHGSGERQRAVNDNHIRSSAQCCQGCLTCMQCNQRCPWAINGYAIEEYCIHWQQAGYISRSPNLAYTTGHVARAAGGESILYFTKTSVTICSYGGRGKKEGEGKKSCELNGS